MNSKARATCVMAFNHRHAASTMIAFRRTARTATLSFAFTVVILQAFHSMWLVNMIPIDLHDLKSQYYLSIPIAPTVAAAIDDPPKKHNATSNFLDLSGVTSLVVNVGSNVDPILPKQSDGPCAISIAFEPVVPERIKQHPQLHVVPAAVSNHDGLSVMHLYNTQGASSSLSQAAGKQAWNSSKRRRDGRKKVVPLVSFKTLFESIPPDIPINYIRTDMQGHDFLAFVSAGDLPAKRGVKFLETETHPDETVQYKGAHNDLCRDWLPHMTRIGYVLEGARDDYNKRYPEFENAVVSLETCRKRLKSNPERPPGNPESTLTYNAFWRLKTEALSTNTDAWDYPNFHPKRPSPLVPKFSPQQYASCHQN